MELMFKDVVSCVSGEDMKAKTLTWPPSETTVKGKKIVSSMWTGMTEVCATDSSGSWIDV